MTANEPKCLSPQHHRAECECAVGATTKCEGCGIPYAHTHKRVELTNGGLVLCGQCLAEFNGKNPQLKALEAERDALVKRFAQLRKVAGELAAALDACIDIITSAVHENAAPLVALGALASAAPLLEAST